MQITLKVFRYNPESGVKSHFDSYSLNVDPTERILDLLEHVKAHHDSSLAYRRSCAHGMCGSDAMRINGHNALACKTLVQDFHSHQITVEPLLGLRVVKDLMVDIEPFFDHYRSVLPYLINPDPLPENGKERLQSPQERERIDDATRCILCAACTTSCPVFWENGNYVGPAAIVSAYRFIFDSRDRGAVQRLHILNERSGAWACRTAFNCTEVCPREIPITRAIVEVKKAIASGKL